MYASPGTVPRQTMVMQRFPGGLSTCSYMADDGIKSCTQLLRGFARFANQTAMPMTLHKPYTLICKSLTRTISRSHSYKPYHDRARKSRVEPWMIAYYAPSQWEMNSVQSMRRVKKGRKDRLWMNQ